MRDAADIMILLIMLAAAAAVGTLAGAELADLLLRHLPLASLASTGALAGVPAGAPEAEDSPATYRTTGGNEIPASCALANVRWYEPADAPTGAQADPRPCEESPGEIRVDTVGYRGDPRTRTYAGLDALADAGLLDVQAGTGEIVPINGETIARHIRRRGIRVVRG